MKIFDEGIVAAGGDGGLGFAGDFGGVDWLAGFFDGFCCEADGGDGGGVPFGIVIADGLVGFDAVLFAMEFDEFEIFAGAEAGVVAGA